MCKKVFLSIVLSIICGTTHAHISKQKADTITTKVFNILKSGTIKGYIGEPGITQLEHALQAAQEMLQKLNATLDDLDNPKIALSVFGALLHDIGHLSAPKNAPDMQGYGVVKHETIGADYMLALGAPQELADLIASHANAKRYLSTVDHTYYDNLSNASKCTMEFQGGFMKQEELTEFKKHPLFKQMLLLRLCDDAAKKQEYKTFKLEDLKQPFLQFVQSEFKEKKIT